MPIIATIGDANIIGNTVSQANLTVLGAYSNLTGALNVSGVSNLTSLNVASTANFLANTTFLANTQHLGNVYFGNINSYGTSNLYALNVAGQANILQATTVVGAANLLSTLTVGGATNLQSTSTLTGAANLLSTLGVQGAAWLLSTVNVSANINTASNLSVNGFANVGILNVTSTSNFVGNQTILGNSNIFGTSHNVASSNSYFMGTVNVIGTTNVLSNVILMNTFGVTGQANIFSTLGVTGQANILGTIGVTGQANLLSTLGVQGAVNTFSTMNVATILSVMQSANLYKMNVQTDSILQQGLTIQGQTNINSLSNINSLVVPGTSNLAQLGVYGNLVVEANSNLKGTVNIGQTMNAFGNISTPGNVIVGSNIVPGASGFNAGNVLVTGNLVVQGNIFSTSGALGSIGGLVLTNPSTITLDTPFANDANGNAFSFTLSALTISGTSAFISVSAGGNIKFQLPGTYLLTGLLVGSQSVSRIAIGSSVLDNHPTTKNYVYVHNQDSNRDFSIPLVINDQSLYYYVDLYSPVNSLTVAPTTDTLGSTAGTYLAVNSYGTFVPQSLNLTVPWMNTVSSANIWVSSSVGIGTVAPNSKLSLGGNAAFGTYGATGVAAPINGLILDGNVGFGTSTPMSNLAVIGNAVVTSNIWVGSFANIGGYANVVGSFSAAASNLQSLVVSYDSIVNRNSNVLGATNLNSTANITGVTNVASSFSAGLTNLQSLNVTTTSNIVGATTIVGTMNIQSTTNVNSAFSALGQGIFGGNLGVFCNTAPTRTLDVLGSAVIGSAAERLILNSTYIGFNRDPIAAVNYTSSAFAYQLNHTQSTTSTNDYLAVQVYNQTGVSVSSTALVINGLGNVGIGIQPSTKLDVGGAIAISGTTVIDSSRNLTNIGTVGCGAITATSVTASTSYNTSGSAIYQVSGTTVIDASRNLTNIGTVGCGAITSSAGISGTTGTYSSTLGVIVNTNAGSPVIINQNLNGGSSAYAVMQWQTDTGSAYIFKNSSTRSADGPVKCCTFRNDDGDLRLAAASTNPYIFLQSSTGRMGLNTTSPSYLLHVAGDAFITGLLRINSTNPLYFESYGGGWFMQDTTYMRVYNNKTIYTGGSIYCDSSFIMGGTAVIDSSRNLVNIGSVGCGTINTTGSINLSGNSTRIQFNSTSTWSGGAGTSFGKLEYHAQRWYINAGTNSDRIVQFRRGETDTSWIDNSGVYQGSINGATGTFSSTVALTETNANLGLNRGAIWFNGNGDTNHYLYNNYNNRDGAGGFDGMKWNTYNGLWVRGGASGANTGIFMSSSGAVGIGTTNPDYKLRVQGNAYVTTDFRGNEVYTANWFRNDAAQTGLYNSTSGAAWQSNYENFGTWRVYGNRVNDWGGIHFPDDGMNLMMRGNECGFHRNGDGWRMYVVGNDLYVRGNLTAYWSDRRLKKDFIEVEDYDAILNGMTAYRFKWNALGEKVTNGTIKEGEDDLALIAQDVQAVLPGAVCVNKAACSPENKSDEQTEYLTINYDKITPILVQALKSTREELRDVKERLARLEKLLLKE
jgi:hypothetical protein